MSLLQFQTLIVAALASVTTCRPQHAFSVGPVLGAPFAAADPLILPKHATIKFERPIGGDDKFYPLFLSKKAKFFVGKLTDSWSASDAVKNIDKEVGLEEPFRPVSVPVFGGLNSLPHTWIFRDDVKPVTEHIEDDIKYDFRTMTHSI